MTWNTITAYAQQYIVLLLGGLAILILLLFLFCIVLLLKIRRERKRYDFFMGANRRPDYNLETQMKEYFTRAKEIDEKYTNLLNMVTDMDKTMKSNIRKVGLVRYNPFQEMGGNLCFALALLDGEDNGVVLNGIHSRTGSFTYAKPIEMGVSTYLLSEEELEAIQIAREKAYEPEHEKVKTLKFKPLFKRRYTKVEEKAKKEALGDVTEAEKAQIAAETAVADTIAAADTIAVADQIAPNAYSTTSQTKAETPETQKTQHNAPEAQMTQATDTATEATPETVETAETAETAEAIQTDTSAKAASTNTASAPTEDVAPVDVTSPETQACFATLLSHSRKTDMEQAEADLPPMPQEEFTFPGILSEDLSHLPHTENEKKDAEISNASDISDTSDISDMPDIPYLDTVHPRKHRLMRQAKDKENMEHHSPY